MRRLLLIPLLIAGFVSAHLASSDHQSRRRKTMGFGPAHPHAVFRTIPVVPRGLTPLSDPFAVAVDFVEDLLGNQLAADNTYTVREDSYTDKNTGVSHVYIRQIINGIEVADGDLNVNVKDGIVISYGDSFYKGSAPAQFTSPGDDLAHHHQQYCADLLQVRLADNFALQGEQTIMGDAAPKDADLGVVDHLDESNCAWVDLPYSMAAEYPAEQGDSRHALLQFMVAALPDPDLANDILTRRDEYLAGLTSEFDVHLVGHHGIVIETVSNVPGTVNPVKSKMAYIQVPDGDRTELQLVWKFEVEMQDNWYEAALSFKPPHRIISVVDWASDSPLPSAPPVPGTYNIFAWGINDPSVGNRSIVKEPFDSIASPVGWHTLPFAHDPQSEGSRRKSSEFYRNTTTTWGNNVFAHENWEGRNAWVDNIRPDGGEDRIFNFTYDPQWTNTSDDSLVEAKKYINATIAQLFYTSNLVHDLYYRYGFDEVSGNFQQYNFGRGGKENDGVIANAQDGSGFNNANFMTPPDGQNGRCRMYLWNSAIPYRDGDLEAGIVIHELSHGLSTRLTGGPLNSGCLGWGESGGMGEGWGDFLATIIRSNKVYADYPMGAWAANDSKGIRNYIYSVNNTINPSTYKNLDKPGYWGVHAIGEVWAEMLWVVSQRLIAQHGYVDSLFPPAPLEDGTIPLGDFYRPRVEDPVTGKLGPLVPKHGNSLIVQLVLDGMKLQPCNPSFFAARDAIIQADQVLTGGENFCDLWTGFAERGLGIDAKVEGRTPWGGGIRTNGYEIPLLCEPSQKDVESWELA